MPPDYKLALFQIEDMLAQITLLELNGVNGAEEFYISVGVKIKGMRDYIKKNEVCTPKMKRALDNMQGGLQRWIDNIH